jgi:SAM-dependent methyltransferase
MNRELPKRCITGVGDSNPQSQYEILLGPIKTMFKGNSVLDLGCYTGYSTNLMYQYGATRCKGLDIIDKFVKTATEQFANSDVSFICDSLTNKDLIRSLSANHNIVATFGTFYHLYNHFELISAFCQPNVHYVLIDTLYGPETADTSMFWFFENSHPMLPEPNIIAKGTPNLSWINQACNRFGFKLDYIHRYHSERDFNLVKDHESNKRMTLRFFNPQKVNKSTQLDINQTWQWNNNKLIDMV